MGCSGSKATAATSAAKSPSATGDSPAASGTLLQGHAHQEVAAAVPKDALAGAQSRDTLSSKASRGMLRRQRTLTTDRYELDVMVVGFSAHDSSVGNALGRNCKELKWRVMYDLHSEPIDICVRVQEHKLHYNGVSVECNGRPIFQGEGGQKAKMIEDLHYQWPFRASIRGLGEPDLFELRMPYMHGETWVPATITCQREDGFFEATAFQYGSGGWHKQMPIPAVSRKDIREKTTGAPPAVPECCLHLHVPHQDPLRASLSMDGSGEQITHCFGRPSPPPVAKGQELAKVRFQVSQDRRVVSADVGHATLHHFVSGEVRAVNQEFARMKHLWRFQLGPFAEHTVEVVKKYTLGTILTLIVDGEVLVEAAASDLGVKSGEWKCDFRFVGERLLNFEVHKTNKEGTVLPEKGSIEQIRKYTHQCSVLIPNDWEFSTGICRADTAQFFIDGTAFGELPVVMPKHEEPNLKLDARALQQLYNITTPYVVDHAAPSTMMVMTNNVLQQADEHRQAATQAVTGLFSSSLWTGCCKAPTPEGVEIIVPTSQVLTAEHVTDSPKSNNSIKL